MLTSCAFHRSQVSYLDLKVVFPNQRSSADTVAVNEKAPLLFQVNVNEPSEYSERILWFEINSDEAAISPVIDDIVLSPTTARRPQRVDPLSSFIELSTDSQGRTFIALSHAPNSGKVISMLGSYGLRVCVNYRDSRGKVIAVARSRFFILDVGRSGKGQRYREKRGQAATG
jgi:hypothetical protein